MNDALNMVAQTDNLNYSHCEGLDIYEGKNHKFIGTVINGKLIKPENKMNKFKTKRGLCTVYALICGYMDVYTAGHGLKCTMELDGVYHVKLFTKYKCMNNVIGGNQKVGVTGDMWYWSTYDTLKEARKAYALAKREVKRVYKL